MKNASFEKVYYLVSKIPKGKVTTYGTIGKKLHMSPRVVGQALHANPYEGKIPCHRVVNKIGRLASTFAFGGKNAQKRLLEAEGVVFKDDFVDMSASYILL
ncbi:MAG: MGMT family protein [Candidatus Levybacteria bacterium]|nr:MGMT family protein [Candidatus Levybacteria bacterium]MBP9815187.1 MGMT family protein [Candidatus Levybacteria bacterium]